MPLPPELPSPGHLVCVSCRPRGGRAGWGLGVRLAPTGSGGALVFLSCSLARTPKMSGVARLFPCPSSFLHGRVQPGLALSYWGGRRAPPELGPLPSLGADPRPACEQAPPHLWGLRQRPEVLPGLLAGAGLVSLLARAG